MGHDRRDVCAHAGLSHALVPRAGRPPPPSMGQRRRHPRGRARHGQCAYIVHFTLPWVTLRAFKVARERPRGLSGLAFLVWLPRAPPSARVPRVEDPEFRGFVRRELRERARRSSRSARAAAEGSSLSPAAGAEDGRCAGSPASHGPRALPWSARRSSGCARRRRTAGRTPAACTSMTGIGLGIQRLRVIDLVTGDQPIHNEDGTVTVVLNGEIYNFRELRRRLSGNGHTLRHRGRHRGDRPPLRGARAGVRARAARDVRVRPVGQPQAPAAAGARPGRQEAAVLLRAPGRAQLRLGAAGADAGPGGPARDRPPGARRLPGLRLRAGADERVRGGAQADAGAAPSPIATERSQIERYWRLDYSRKRRARSGARGRGGDPRRRSAGRCAVGWWPTCRWGRSSRAASTPRRWWRAMAESSSRADQDVLDRVRGRALQRAAPGPARGPGVRRPTTTSCSCAPTRSSCCRRSFATTASRSPTTRRCPRSTCRASRAST